MAEPGSLGERQAALRQLLGNAASGKYKAVYLFHGESLATLTAARSLIDALVPPRSRSFNLETYDGRTTPMATVLDSLRMRGFFGGVKVVWIRESTVFLSGEKRPEIATALLAAWVDGREQEAVEKLLTLVALAGWTQELLVETRFPAASKSRIKEVFGDDLDTEEIANAEAVRVACLARGLSVSAFRDDGSALLEFLDAGMPPDSVLLFTASAVDARKRSFKRLSEIGAVVDLSAARERSGALSREAIDDLIRTTTQDHGKQLSPQAHQLILRRAGADAALVAMELEKLCLSVADQAVVDEDAVRISFRDMAESWIFDFTGALATRQLRRALPLLRGLIGQGEPPLRLVAMIVRELRLLLVARECLDHSLRGKWRNEMPFNAFQGQVLPHVDSESSAAFGKTHPFVLYRRFQDAGRVRASALRAALVRLSDLDLRLKSSRTDPELLLESFLIDWCRASGLGSAARTPG